MTKQETKIKTFQKEVSTASTTCHPLSTSYEATKSSQSTAGTIFQERKIRAQRHLYTIAMFPQLIQSNP